ncbi:MAG TPA: helix-turn-helix domain-containing protein [Pyrinomonadaceae bacterium]
MSTAKAEFTESINKRHLRGLPSRTKTGQPNDRLKKMRDLASELLEESEALEHEGELAEASHTIATLSANTAINFFEEVRQFEVRLINRALKLAGGNQARAAQLLGLGTTTLNYKVKTYGLL